MIAKIEQENRMQDPRGAIDGTNLLGKDNIQLLTLFAQGYTRKDVQRTPYLAERLTLICSQLQTPARTLAIIEGLSKQRAKLTLPPTSQECNRTTLQPAEKNVIIQLLKLEKPNPPATIFDPYHPKCEEIEKKFANAFFRPQEVPQETKEPTVDHHFIEQCTAASIFEPPEETSA